VITASLRIYQILASIFIDGRTQEEHCFGNYEKHLSGITSARPCLAASSLWRNVSFAASGKAVEAPKHAKMGSRNRNLDL
jgi:hypothetical protein